MLFGLVGPVKSVKYNHGNYYEFNKDGNLTKRHRVFENSLTSGDSRDYFDKSTTMIIKSDNGSEQKYKIVLPQDTKELRAEDDLDGFETETYYYNTKGQLVKYQGIQYVEEYAYNDKEVFPSSLTYGGGDEEGSYSTTETYTYTKKDEKGNWIERNVVAKSVEEDANMQKTTETKKYVEKREITY